MLTAAGTYIMLGNKTLWEAAQAAHAILDFADVVELIAAHNLSRSFARHLHKSLRETFRELVLHARGG